MKSLFAALIALGLLIVAVAPQAQASGSNNVELGLSLLKFDRDTEGPTLGTSSQKWTLYDLKLGYIFQNDIYLGVIYSGYKEETPGNTNTRDMLGGTIGYHNDGWFIDGSYLFQARLVYGGATLNDGNGYAIDIGYNAMMGQNFYLGVQASYKSVTYTERDSVSETNKEKSELYPMLNLGIMF